MIDALLQQLFRSRVFKIKQRKQPIIRIEIPYRKNLVKLKRVSNENQQQQAKG